MQKIAIVILSLCLLCSVASFAVAITISEIMYNPGQCPDTDCEWIELYNDASDTNLSACTLNGHQLTGSLAPGSYRILARNQTAFSEYFNQSAAISPLALNLKNSGDIINLSGSSFCNITIDYGPFISLANGNNHTLERTNRGIWEESLMPIGTPGSTNSVALLSSRYAALSITEVMPDPFGDDDANKPLGEWIELYNSGNAPLNLERLALMDKDDDNEIYIAHNKVLNSTIIPAHSYSVIYRDADSDFSLNNIEYDEVRLFADDSLIDKVSYFGSTEGMSWSKMEGNWYLAPPTPGYENINLPDCDWRVELNAKNSIFTTEGFSFNVSVIRQFGLAGNITMHGQIEDYFGKVVREYTPFSNDYMASKGSKKYSPNLPEGIYQLRFWLANISCDRTAANDKATMAVVINPRYQNTHSSLSIDKINLGSDSKARWAQQLNVGISVYKGNDTKKAVELWAEKQGDIISKRSTLSAENQYQNYEVTIPVQLLPNCAKETGQDGDATLILEGLGQHAEAHFRVEGLDPQICKEYSSFIRKQEKEAAQEKKELTARVISAEKTVAGDVLRIQVPLWDTNAHQYKVWSYVYKGKKCYSCQHQGQKEKNLKSVKLAANEYEVLEQLIPIDDDAPEGEYSLMVKINKDNQKTSKSISKPLYVFAANANRNLSSMSSMQLHSENDSLGVFSDGFASDDFVAVENMSTSLQKRPLSTSKLVVYQSNAEKAKELRGYFVAISFILVAMVLMLKWE